MGISQIKPNTVELTKFQYNVQMRVSRELVGDWASQNMALQMLEDHMTDSIVAQFKAFAYGREEDLIHYQHPATWWEHLKIEFYALNYRFEFLNRLRRWAERRFPVKFIRLEWKVRELYPTYVFPNARPVIKVMMNTGVSTEAFPADDPLLRRPKDG